MDGFQIVAGQATSVHLYNTIAGLWENERGNNNPLGGDWTYSASNQTFLVAGAIDDLLNSNAYINFHSQYLPPGRATGTGNAR